MNNYVVSTKVPNSPPKGRPFQCPFRALDFYRQCVEDTKRTDMNMSVKFRVRVSNPKFYESPCDCMTCLVAGNRDEVPRLTKGYVLFHSNCC